jgi:hypothetical protein
LRRSPRHFDFVQRQLQLWDRILRVVAGLDEQELIQALLAILPTARFAWVTIVGGQSQLRKNRWHQEWVRLGNYGRQCDKTPFRHRDGSI